MISLDEMASLARVMAEAEDAVRQQEASLKEAKEKARRLREETIPAAMQELGIDKLELNTGEKISVSQEVYASIPNEHRDDAFRWLNDNGFGGLIKVGVSSSYGKGEQSKAMELFQELQERGLNAKFDEGVHPQTLKAILKEQISTGANVPLDLFGARPVWTAKIKKS